VLEIARPTGSSGLFYDTSSFTLAESPPSKGAVLLASGAAEPRGVALLAVHPESGMLFYAELGAGNDPVDLGPLRDVFASLGFSDFTFLPARWALRLGDGTALDGQAIHPLKGDVTRLVRRPGPGGARFFEDTPIVPRDEWYPLQQHRVRYFKKQD
jgi:hypothetical protein